MGGGGTAKVLNVLKSTTLGPHEQFQPTAPPIDSCGTAHFWAQ